MIRYDREILKLGSDELELFVYDWVDAKAKLGGYHEVERFSGPGDRGRDVVGFCAPNRHEGLWDNYQCKQYAGPVDLGTGLLELSKLLYYAYQGEFTPPRRYMFVAPRGVTRPLQLLINKPSELQKTLLDRWDKHCRTSIADGEDIPLNAALKAFIEAYDFSNVSSISVEKMLADACIKPVLVKHFGADPGPAPKGTAPTAVLAAEAPYIRQLVDAYGECDGCTYPGHEAVSNHPKHGVHLKLQRERFFDADAFQRFYRDNSTPESLEQLEEDIFHGVVEVHAGPHSSTLAQVSAVMIQAANVKPSGLLAPHARIPVKQGICHHFANAERLKWGK